MMEPKKIVLPVGVVKINGEGKVEKVEKPEDVVILPTPDDAVAVARPGPLSSAVIPDGESPVSEEEVAEKQAESKELFDAVVAQADQDVLEGQKGQETNNTVLAEMADNTAKPVEEPIVTDDPSLTQAPPENEFKGKVQDGRVDLENEGGVSRVVNDVAPVQPDKVVTIPDSALDGDVMLGDKESPFKAETVQNALKDSPVEGGIVSNKSASSLRSDDPAKDGGQMKTPVAEASVSDKFRLYGFTVQFIVDGKITTRHVSDYFDDIENAFVSINGGKYLMPHQNGFKVVDIVSGIPIISHQEQAVYQHVGAEWKKA
jgi:hypothetical protein